MNNTGAETVPARIVIIGTSKMRLSERFNKLQKAAPPPPPKQQPQQVSLRKESVGRHHYQQNGGGISVGQMVARPRVVDDRDRPPPSLLPPSRTQSVAKSFLHDDYMDNDLYGGAITPEPMFHRRAPAPPRLGVMRSASYYEPLDYDEPVMPAPDPLKLSLEDYDHYSRIRTAQRRRSIHSRITHTARGRFLHSLPLYELDEEGFYDGDGDDLEDPRRSRSVYSRRSIHQRISFNTRLSDYDYLRRPLHRNTMMFKRPLYNRGSRFSFGRTGGGGWGRRAVGPFGRRSGGGGGGGRWGDKRLKKSVAEMDRELEEYMRSAKHPRVKPIVAS